MKFYYILFVVLFLAIGSNIHGATTALETWDNGLDNGWTYNTTITTVEVRSSGGNPGGWLFSYGTGSGSWDIGAKTLKSDFTGDYQSAKISHVSLDISLINGDFDQAWIRFRYLNSGYNGWMYPLHPALNEIGWQTFNVDFDPSWSDEEARSAGWVTDRDVYPSANPSQPFAITMSNVYSTSVRLSGNGYLEAGIDNFRIDTQNISLVINQVDISNYPTIEIFLSVSDQNGNSIDNLTKENFSLFEDGNEYLQFEVYPPGTYTYPISVALALDYSGSMAISDSVPDLETAVKQFIDGLDSDDKAEIIIFKNTEVFVAQPFTSDKDLLKNAIGGDAEGGTALYDAIYQAISDTAMQDDRKAVIVMTDGKDRTSKYYTKEDVILYSQQTGIPIFCVGLGDADKAILQEISDETGGQFFYAPTSDDLTSIYQEIGEVLQDQYLLSYQTTIADNLSHQVEIQATSDGKTGSDIKDFQLNLDYAPYFENASLPTSATIPEIINFSGSVKDDIELSQITMIVDGPSGVHTVFTEDLSGTSTSLSGYFFDSGNTIYANAPGSYNVELKVVDSSNHSTSQNFTVNILGGYNNSIAEIIGTWSDGIRYWDVAVSEWTKMTDSAPTGDITAGDFTGDGKADVASCWGSGLWYQDGATLGWSKVSGTAPNSLTAGDVTGDGQAEIIGTWSSGIWYWDVAASEWTKMSSGMPSGDITAGDFTGDSKADVASIWASGLWFQDGDSLAWTKVTRSAPNSLTAGDVTGDGQAEIIGTWSSGIWYWDVAASEWTKMSSGMPSGDITAGDFTDDGKEDVASCWGSGLWYQDGASLAWTKISSQTPAEVTAGDVTGD